MNLDLERMKAVVAAQIEKAKNIKYCHYVDDGIITRLSYWFPKLERVGLPVPKTVIIPGTEKEIKNLVECYDDKKPRAVLDLVERIHNAAESVEYPFFLRNDFTSAKHQWDKSCFVKCKEDILSHMVQIFEYAECAQGGTPIDVWVVRELLPTIKRGVCRRYHNMPVVKEFRYFVDGCKIECYHPYWPKDALEQGDVEWIEWEDWNPELVPVHAYKQLCSPLHPLERPEIETLVQCAGCAVGGGRWSVDVLETEKGWYITDMAQAHVSHHWEGCPVNEQRMQATLAGMEEEKL